MLKEILASSISKMEVKYIGDMTQLVGRVLLQII